MVKMRKLNFIGSGNEGGRFFYIFDKKDSFFSLFPLFLKLLGFNEFGVYEEYKKERPKLDDISNLVEHFKNKDYDVDLVYTLNRIILIIRTDKNNRKKLLYAVKKISKF